MLGSEQARRPNKREMVRLFFAITKYTMDANVLIIGNPIKKPMQREDFSRDLFKISETAAAPSNRPAHVTNHTEDK